MKRRTWAAALGAAAILSTATVRAQLPAGELRLWLKADSLQLTEDAQVKQWVDQSPNGTVFEPRTTRWNGFSVEENPHLQTVTVNGRTFPTVKFERDGSLPSGNPAVDRSGSTDRLYQTTNLTPGSDPLAIGDGTSITSFTVFKPLVTTSGALGYQAIWGKRGDSASLYQLGINQPGRFNYVTYDSITEYQTSNKAVANKWQIVSQQIIEAGANDPLKFLVNDTENPLNPLVDWPVATNGGLIADRNDGINEDPPGSVEPFGIGGHAQDCCGEGETFAGNIAEIIIYGRELSQAESDQVYAYLTDKYLANAVPEPTAALLATFGLMGFGAVRRRRA